MGSLVAVPSLKEFFRHVLTDAARRHAVQLQEGTEFYLVNLLSEFAETGKLDEEPLAVLYHRALHQEREDRIRTLRRLGDVSLYQAGFFSPALRETAVGPDYYIEMGGAAYDQVATLSTASAFSDVYRELGTKFRALVQVLEEIAARGLASNGPEGLLRVYDTWSRTGNARLERVLIDVGLVPPKDSLPN